MKKRNNAEIHNCYIGKEVLSQLADVTDFCPAADKVDAKWHVMRLLVNCRKHNLMELLNDNLHSLNLRSCDVYRPIDRLRSGRGRVVASTPLERVPMVCVSDGDSAIVRREASSVALAMLVHDGGNYSLLTVSANTVNQIHSSISGLAPNESLYVDEFGESMTHVVIPSEIIAGSSRGESKYGSRTFQTFKSLCL